MRHLIRVMRKTKTKKMTKTTTNIFRERLQRAILKIFKFETFDQSDEKT